MRTPTTEVERQIASQLGRSYPCSPSLSSSSSSSTPSSSSSSPYFFHLYPRIFYPSLHCHQSNCQPHPEPHPLPRLKIASNANIEKTIFQQRSKSMVIIVGFPFHFSCSHINIFQPRNHSTNLHLCKSRHNIDMREK